MSPATSRSPGCIRDGALPTGPPGVPIAEVAEGLRCHRAKCSTGRFERVVRMWAAGGLPDDLIEIDMDAVEGEGIVHLGNANYLSRPSGSPATKPSRWWSPCRRSVRWPPAGCGRPADGAVGMKLAHVTGHHDPVLLAVNIGDEELREQLVSVIERDDASKADLRRGHSHGETTAPVVDPASIQMRDAAAYLLAWSLSRETLGGPSGWTRSSTWWRPGGASRRRPGAGTGGGLVRRLRQSSHLGLGAFGGLEQPDTTRRLPQTSARTVIWWCGWRSATRPGWNRCCCVWATSHRA